MSQPSSSFIRWRYVAPTGIGLSVIVGFFTFFFDPLLGRVLSMAATQANGAKVDVEGLSTKLFRGRLAIKKIQVTDPSNTWVNMVEMGPLAFELDPSELLTKRVIIPQASLDGLQFGTARKSDGRLIRPSKKVSADKPSAAAALADKYQDKFQMNFQGMKADAKAKVEFDPKNLNITKQADELKTKADTLPDNWKSKVDNLKVQDRLKQIEAELKEVQNSGGGKGLEAIKGEADRLKKLKQAKSDLDSLKNDLKSTREGFSSEIKSLQSGVAGLKDAKKKDMDDLLSRFNLDFADPRRLVEGMIGDSILGKVRLGLRYVEMAKAYMPSKKDQSLPPPRPRFKGIDIQFPTPAAPPRFWLKKASLSGIYKEVAAAGGMTDLTTDPPRVGRPFRADLKGQSAANPFALNAMADHTGQIAKDSLHLVVGNLGLQTFLKGGFLGDSLKQGSGDLDFVLTVIEGAPLNGTLKLNMKGLKLDESSWLSKAGVEAGSTKKEDAFKAQFLKNVARGFETMPAFSVVADISGSWTSPEISIHSNAGDMLGKVVKESMGALIGGQQKELEAKLDGILKGRSAELTQKTSGLQDKMNGLLGGLDKDVQDKINHATGLGSSSGGGSSSLKIPSLDNLFK